MSVSSKALDSVPCEKILERMEVRKDLRMGKKLVIGKMTVGNIEIKYLFRLSVANLVEYFQ